MSEEDTLEIQPPKRRLFSGDALLGLAGLAIAAAAAFFPWYVFYNQDEFGIKPVALDSRRDLPEIAGRDTVTVSPLAIPDRDDGTPEPEAFDPIQTATVPSLGDEGDGAPLESGPQAQPFPVARSYKLLHVANGRALIEDDTGMYIVRIGSVLPDNSKLATLEERDGKWVIVTSKGDVIGR